VGPIPKRPFLGRNRAQAVEIFEVLLEQAIVPSGCPFSGSLLTLAHTVHKNACTMVGRVPRAHDETVEVAAINGGDNQYPSG